MPSSTEQLDRDGLAVLYLAGEASDEQRAEAERLLAGDAAFAVLVSEARAAHGAADAALRELDERQRPPVSEGVAVRRVTRAMQQWQVDRLRKPAPPAPPPWRMPWWSYPVGGVAAVITVFLVWSTRQPIRPLPADEQTTVSMQKAEIESENESLATWLEAGFVVRGDEVAMVENPGAAAAVTPAMTAPGTNGDEGGGGFLIPPREDVAW